MNGDNFRHYIATNEIQQVYCEQSYTNNYNHRYSFYSKVKKKYSGNRFFFVVYSSCINYSSPSIGLHKSLFTLGLQLYGRVQDRIAYDNYTSRFILRWMFVFHGLVSKIDIDVQSGS